MKQQFASNTYLVWAHPRVDSLTAAIVGEIKQEAGRQNMGITELDLYRANFNPVLPPDEEPDWSNPDKVFSKEVTELFQAMENHDNIVVVFPVWWFAFPAILKGYIDRIWNYGLAYGRGHKLPVSSVRWVALVGGAEKKFKQMGKDTFMTDQLNGLAKYCGTPDSDVAFLYNTIGFEENINNADTHYQQLLAQARSVVVELTDKVRETGNTTSA
ncbi:NAD(P)H oxidoreductase [Scandinavium sp. H11S7]|uniref:NAD(P)H oxidoreductase n=1 Tax=Scandinavium hiltneri TaxID=2926519 RepID=A0ABT2E7N9_9ENTR|nr:NAD(P)H oxidoreductase [Scandinavium hiltneri]MCS2163908.1 NAD(P)H oxidoreductase [Scandinavium hiltneri]